MKSQASARLRSIGFGLQSAVSRTRSRLAVAPRALATSVRASQLATCERPSLESSISAKPLPRLESLSFSGLASGPAFAVSNVEELSLTLTFGRFPRRAFLASLPFALTLTSTPLWRIPDWLSLTIFSATFFLPLATVSADAVAARPAQSARASRAISSRDILIKTFSPPSGLSARRLPSGAGTGRYHRRYRHVPVHAGR